MGAFINIFYHSMGSMLIGVLLTLIGCILMFVLIRGWWRNCAFTPISILVGVVLFLFLSFQSVLFCGAITIKSYGDKVEDYVNALVQNIPVSTEFSTQQTLQVLNHISEEWPLVGYYVNQADFQGHTPADIATAMVDELRSYMNLFMLRRLGWSLLFVVIGATLVIKTLSTQNSSGRSPRQRMERTTVNRQRVSSRSTRRGTRR